jgi:hypothetical protein
MSNKCGNCGCSMSGGFCSNCHEEVFIAEQYSDLGEECPASIHNRAAEHIKNKERIKMHKKQLKKEHNQKREEEIAYYGESKLAKQ